MAADKYQTIVSGEQKLITGTVTSTGVTEAGKIVALGTDGKLDPTVMPTGVAADVKNMVTSENLAAGDYVNVYSNAGVVTARLADQSNARPAHGFVTTSVTSPAPVNVYFEGVNSNRSGQTKGARQYLGTVGQSSESPFTTGLHQYIGLAVSTTEADTEFTDYVVMS